MPVIKTKAFLEKITYLCNEYENMEIMTVKGETELYFYNGSDVMTSDNESILLSKLDENAEHTGE